MSIRKPLNLEAVQKRPLQDIPINVVKHYVMLDKSIPIKVGEYQIPTDTEYDRYVTDLNQYEFADIATRVMQVEKGAIKSSGYYNLEKEFSKGDLVPEAYNHETAFAAIQFLHLKITMSDSVQRMLEEKFPIIPSSQKKYTELISIPEPTQKQMEEMDDIDDNRLNRDEIVETELTLYRGVPTIHDEQNSILYRAAQTVLELPFAFCRVMVVGGTLNFDTPKTSTFIDGLATVYGLSKNFAYDITRVLKQMVTAIVEKPTLDSNHYENALKIMSIFAQDREQCIKIAAKFSKVLYGSVSAVRQKKYFKSLPKKFADAANPTPLLWTDSFRFRELPADAFATFKLYTRYLLMMQEMRGKKDKFSDKMYRLPVGAGPVQIHFENALSLAENSGKEVVVVHHDTNTLIKIAWILKLNNIKGVYVNMTELPGKLAELKAYTTNNFKDRIKFNYKCTTIASPKQDKNKTEAFLFHEMASAHFDYFHSMANDSAVVVKSFYFPNIPGITYYPSSEPHNGSIIAVRGDVVAEPTGSYEEQWEACLQNRKRALSYSYYKTMFTVSREHTMRKVMYRPPVRCEPIAPSLGPGLEYVEADVDQMGEMEDDYEPEIVKVPQQSTNSSNSSVVTTTTTTVTSTAQTTGTTVTILSAATEPSVPFVSVSKPPEKNKTPKVPLKKKRKEIEEDEEPEPLLDINDE